MSGFTIDEVRAFWDAVADRYVHEADSLAAAHFQRFDRAFAHFHPRDCLRALNIWSRNGEAIDYFRSRNPQVELVNAEVSPRLIEKARARFPRETFVQTDLASLPFADGEFDFILSLETLEHAPDPLRFLRELARVLKPGGTLVLSCPPATAELPLRIYERLLPNHGEGPHRFLSSREVKGLVRAAGLELKQHESTLFIPVGPRWLRRLDPLVERAVARTPLRELGIRQFFICRRPRRTGPWQELLRDVVQTGLCTRCGTCVGVCPSGVLEFAAIDQQCLPAAVRPEACAGCGLCRDACPGKRVSFAELHASAGDAPVASAALGPIRRVRLAHARDPAVRSAGGSGGAVTAMLCGLLDRDEITGAIVLDAHPAAPWRPWPRIARTRDEILRAAQSKYCVTPTNVALREIDPDADRLAIVALPCQIHALRTLQRRGWPAMKAVSLVVGLYCGNQLHFAATRSFLNRHGVSDLSEVAQIRYRDGRWPGNVRCVLTDGRAFSIPKVHFNHLISAYVVPRCLLCADLAAEGADVSAGDAWDRQRERSGEGRSLIITRTVRGERAVADAVSNGLLDAEEIDLERALAMHAHALDLKKVGALLRVEALRKRGQPGPVYDLPVPRVSWRRRAAEALVGLHFRLCGGRLGRWIVDHLPFGAVGPLYDAARIVWRRRAASQAGLTQSAADRAPALKPRGCNPWALEGPTRSAINPGLNRVWNFLALPLRAVASPELLHRLGLRSMKDERIDAVLPRVEGRLLDVGCGPGNELVRRYRGPGVGVDAFAWPGIDLVCDTRSIPFGDGEFDTVTIVAALNHIPQREAVLRECCRLLAPGGQLLVTMIGPRVGWLRHRLIAWWDPDQRGRPHADGELDGMSDRQVRGLLAAAGFRLEGLRRFVCGLNRLYVARKHGSPAA